MNGLNSVAVALLTSNGVLYDQIMPLSVRAKGVSLSTATNWAFNWLIGQLTPYLQEKIQWRLYPMHAFFCVSSFILGEKPYHDSTKFGDF